MAWADIPEHERVAAIRTPKAIARFEAKVSPEPMSGCWLWAGAIGNSGHGQFFIKAASGQATIPAHRASWNIHKGEVPPGWLVCHKCDNPFCVNPDHLFVGSYGDNSRDMVAKGRNRCPDGRGEKNPAAKITDAQVIAFRAGGERVGVISRRLGMSATAISDMLRGATFGHLPGARPSIRPVHKRIPLDRREEIGAAVGRLTDVAARYAVSVAFVSKARRLLRETCAVRFNASGKRAAVLGVGR